MGKKPSEMNVAERIFHDIMVHGIDSVLLNKEFYLNYKRLNSNNNEILVNNLKLALNRWIEGSNASAAKMSELGQTDLLMSFSGMSTAYWAVKNFLEVNENTDN